MKKDTSNVKLPVLPSLSNSTSPKDSTTSLKIRAAATPATHRPLVIYERTSDFNINSAELIRKNYYKTHELMRTLDMKNHETVKGELSDITDMKSLASTHIEDLKKQIGLSKMELGSSQKMMSQKMERIFEGNDARIEKLEFNFTQDKKLMEHESNLLKRQVQYLQKEHESIAEDIELFAERIKRLESSVGAKRGLNVDLLMRTGGGLG